VYFVKSETVVLMNVCFHEDVEKAANMGLTALGF